MLQDKRELLNTDFIRTYITNNGSPDSPVAYRSSHGATDTMLGDGLIIYALIRFLRLKTCVCLGSGGGFIPRIMTQARQDLYKEGVFEGDNTEIWGDVGATYVVDACNGVGGNVDWAAKDSFYRKNFEPAFIKATTEDAYFRYFVPEEIKIDYLHIDAGHSLDAVRRDFELYSNLLNPGGIISLHDTDIRYNDSIIIPENQKDDWDDFGGPATFAGELKHSSVWRTLDLFNFNEKSSTPCSTGLTLVQKAR